MSAQVVLSWSQVMHSNHRLIPAKPRKGQFYARLITAPDYRARKEVAELAIKRQWGAREMLKGPVSLTARCFFPDRRKRDVVGYAKLIDDAMTGICFRDDSQIHKETWIRAGLDTLNPRIEITLEPYEEAAA